MKLKKILFVVFALLPITANAKVTISSWQENSQITKSGKVTEIVIQGSATEIPNGMAMSSFSLSFDPKQNIRIEKVIDDPKLSSYNKSSNYSFRNNVLNVKFQKGKGNGEKILLYLYYTEYYDKVSEFLRQEVIYVPAFAAGAHAIVTFNFPGYFESATFNPNVTKSGNSFVYSNIVPQEGVQEIIKLTPAKSVWDVAVRTTITSEKPLGKINVRIPQFFQSEHQKVENNNIVSTVNPLEKRDDNGAKIFNFDINTNQIVVSNQAKITTGVSERKPITRNAASHIQSSAEETQLLSGILQQIKNDPQYSRLPLYAKIGNFVHEYLKYDASYLGKLPKLSDIVQNRVGVCTEYAKLFDALARLAGIPSVIIDGGACGEYYECQGHSWNLIYVNGKWIEVDPTWNLMSGIVSSSHVYFNDDGQGKAGVQYFDKSLNPKIKVDLVMQNLL